MTATFVEAGQSAESNELVAAFKAASAEFDAALRAEAAAKQQGDAAAILEGPEAIAAARKGALQANASALASVKKAEVEYLSEWGSRNNKLHERVFAAREVEETAKARLVEARDDREREEARIADAARRLTEERSFFERWLTDQVNMLRNEATRISA